MFEIGAQLYTVRDLCKTQEETERVLKRVADIGYGAVQVSGIGPFDAAWMKNTCDRLGLKIILTHIPEARLVNETDAVLTEHDIYHCPYIGLGAMDAKYRHTLEGFESFVGQFRPVARAIARTGRLFMYHNHHFEWERVDGVRLIDRLAEAFPADEMGFTLDTYWVQFAGGDPADWLRRLKGRVPCIHLKDMEIVNDGQRMAPVLRGNLNWERIFAAADDAGVKWAFVEQDNAYGEDPLDCLAESYNNLRRRLG